MTSPSPLCTINGLDTTNGVDVSTPSTVTIALADATGVAIWQLVVWSTDEGNDKDTIQSSLSIDNITKTATLPAPSAGSAIIFESIVNEGKDDNGQVDDSLRARFELHTLVNSNRAAALNETVESGMFGWTSKFNALVRNGVATSPNGAAGGDLGGTYPNPSVVKVNGIAVSGTPTTGQVLKATSTSAATWQDEAGGSSFTAGGDLSGTNTSQTVESIQGVVISGTPSSGQVIKATSSSAASWQDEAGGSSFTAGGDLSGTSTSQTVVNITGSGSSIDVVPTHTNITGNSKCKIRTDVANVQTTTATATTAYSWTIASNAVTTIDVVVTACTSTASVVSAGAIARRNMSFRRDNASTVTAIGSVNDNGFDSDTALNAVAVTIDNSGTTGRVMVTGLASTTIQWGVSVQLQEVSQ